MSTSHPYIVIYRIDRTDSGAPAWGIYMSAPDTLKYYSTPEDADYDAQELVEYMRRSGYAVSYQLARTL